MGFYDYRCMATGLSLLGEGAALFLLEKRGERFVPCTLPVVGSYDRLGAIDGVVPTFNVALILAAFRNGAVPMDWRALDEEPRNFSKFEDLSYVLDRSVVDSLELATSGGATLSYALLHEGAAIALMASSTPDLTNLDTTNLVQSAFGDTTFSRTVYQLVMRSRGRDHDDLRRGLAGLIALDRWLEQRGIPWAPPSEPEQHFPEEKLRYLAEARERFSDDRALARAFKEYEDTVAL